MTMNKREGKRDTTNEMVVPFTTAQNTRLFCVDYADMHNGWQQVTSRDGKRGQVRAMRYARPDRVMVVNIPLNSLERVGCALNSKLGDFMRSDSAAATLLKLLVCSRDAPRRVKQKFVTHREPDSVVHSVAGSCIPVCGYLLEGVFSPQGDTMVALRLMKLVLAPFFTYRVNRSNVMKMTCNYPMRDSLLFGRRIDYNQHLQSIVDESTSDSSAKVKRARQTIESTSDARVCSPPDLLRVYQQYGGSTLFDTRSLLKQMFTSFASTDIPTPEKTPTNNWDTCAFHGLSPELLLGMNGGHHVCPQGGSLQAGLAGIQIHPSQLSEESYHHQASFDVPDVSASSVWVLPFEMNPLSVNLPQQVVDALTRLHDAEEEEEASQ